jgi:hypothetical protein
MRRRKRNLLDSRSEKVERIKKCMDLLNSRGFFTLSDLHVSLFSFRFYCESAGGVVVRRFGMTICVKPS